MKQLIWATLLIVLVSCQKENLTPNTGQTQTDAIHNLRTSKVPTGKISKSQGTLLLDFDGFMDTSKQWGGSIVTVGESGITNPIELDSIFNRVYKAFTQFNLIVTTDTTVYNQTAPGRRQRLVLTKDYQWFGSTYGGVSFQGSFYWDDPAPDFVFTSLYNYYWPNIAEAAIHEFGHTLGLKHQSLWVNGVKVNEYRDSVYMGKSYNMPYGGHWATGLNSVGNYQDDVALITQYLSNKTSGRTIPREKTH